MGYIGPKCSSQKEIKLMVLLGSFAVGMMVLLTGCASSIQYPPFPDQSKKVEDASKARLYLIRPARFWGAANIFRYYETSPAAIGPRLGDRLRMIGEMSSGSYLCWESPPGLRVIQSSQGNPKTNVQLDLAAGNVYYFRASLRGGWSGPRPCINVISSDEGQRLLKKCKPPNNYVKNH